MQAHCLVAIEQFLLGSAHHCDVDMPLLWQPNLNKIASSTTVIKATVSNLYHLLQTHSTHLILPGRTVLDLSATQLLLSLL